MGYDQWLEKPYEDDALLKDWFDEDCTCRIQYAGS
jgi:hypothetical protein